MTSEESPRVSVLRDAVITGVAVLVPFAVTLVVLSTVFEFLYAELSALSALFVLLPGVDAVSEGVVDVMVAVVLAGLVVVVGLAVNRTHTGEAAVDYVDDIVSRVPGVGPVYDSFRKMSDAVVESDVQNFRDVKLVEFPEDDVYTLGFLTAHSAPAVREAAGHEEMVALFLPLAPNPIMGGHLVFVPRERVLDVEMTVEEGMQTVVTTGVATGDGGEHALDSEELAALTGVEMGEETAR